MTVTTITYEHTRLIIINILNIMQDTHVKKNHKKLQYNQKKITLQRSKKIQKKIINVQNYSKVPQKNQKYSKILKIVQYSIVDYIIIIIALK